MYWQLLYILSTLSWLPPKSPISTRYNMFSLYQFWYLHILLYSILCQGHSIYLLLASSKQEEQLFLTIYWQLSYILSTLSWFPPKSLLLIRYVFSLYQFWYLHILLYSILCQGHSIYLLLASSKKEEQLFLMYWKLSYILSKLSWFPPKSLISTR